MLARLRRTFFFTMCLCLYWAQGIAAEYGLLIGDNSPAYSEFAEQVQVLTAHTGWRMRWLNKTGGAEAFAPDLIITAGGDALRQAMRQYPQTPILAAMVSRFSFERGLSESPPRSRAMSAVLLDQPPGRLLAFASTLLPNARTAAILAGPESQPQLASLRSMAASNRLRLEQELIGPEQNPTGVLAELLSRSDYLLALPDSQIYRRENIRPILLTSFRYRKPVIGFSQAQVSAGAVAALFVTPGQIARQVADWLSTSPAGSFNSSTIQLSSYYAIAINPTVADSLNLNFPDEAHIRRSINASQPERDNR